MPQFKQRNLGAVMDQMVKEVPELEKAFVPLIDSIRYTPPENMRQRWGDLMGILTTEVPPTHEKAPVILAICNNTPDNPYKYDESQYVRDTNPID